MNLSLLDPFVLAQDCPETLTGRLHSGHSTALRFNRRGDLLASGRLDGTVVIFDIETNGVARKLRGHIRQISSLSWSSDGRYLLSSSQDCKCILWDLQDGSRVRTIKFESGVFIADLHPHNHLLFVAALFDDNPLLVDISAETPRKTQLPSMPKRIESEREKTSEKQLAYDSKQATTVIIFSHSGDHIISGTNKGWLNIIGTDSCQMLHSTRLLSAIIFLLRLTPSGREVVINASDKIIRTVHIPNLTSTKLDVDNVRLEVEHRFQDVVNRLSWNHVTFNSTGEYVVASTWMHHQLYVWERSHGSLVRILEGPKEELFVVECHPHRPFIAASGVESGRVYLWSIVTPQRWSALAPDFAEVEENVEYIEREDEFDIHPIEEIHKRILHQEDEDIDVLTVQPTKTETEDGDFLMPVLLDISDSDSEDDVVAIGTGQFRRKSPGQGKEWMNEEAEDQDGDDHGMPRSANNGSSTSKAAGSVKRRRPATPS